MSDEKRKRVDLSRLGLVGWGIIAALVAAAAIFYRYTLGGLYFAAGVLAYGVTWCLDHALLAGRFPGHPWVGWELAGALIGATLGFWTIAPVYGLRRWRTRIVLAAVIVVVALSLVPVGQPTPSVAASDVKGPVVKMWKKMEVRRRQTADINFIVYDQAANVKVQLVVLDANDKVVSRIKGHSVPTGAWYHFSYHFRLPRGLYSCSVSATDPAGNKSPWRRGTVVRVTRR